MKRKEKSVFFIDGKYIACQKELASFLNTTVGSIANKVFRASRKGENFIELNNRFVKLLTRKEAAEELLTFKIN